MKTSLLSLLLLIGFSLVKPTELVGFELTILHTNDVHSRFEPTNRFGSPCDDDDIKEGQCVGGLSRMAALIEQYRNNNSNNLLLDGGDYFQGSLFYTAHRGQASAKLMNQLGYDAMAIGNHEFDDGSSVLAEFINNVNFPVLSANLKTQPSNPLHGLYAPHTILERENRKIGVIGAVTLDTQSQLNIDHDLHFEEILPSVRKSIEALKQEGVNIVVFASHVGLNADMEMARALPEVDVIISAHSHSLLSNTDQSAEGPYPYIVQRKDGPKTLIVSAGDKARYLGQLQVEFSSEGHITEFSGDTHLVEHSIPADPEVENLIHQLKQKFESTKNRVIAHTEVFLDGSREKCRFEQCSLGALVAEALLWLNRDADVDVALFNSGGIRNSISEGEITIGDVLEALPFDDTMTTQYRYLNSLANIS